MIRRRRWIRRLFSLALLIFLGLSLYRSNFVIQSETYTISGAPAGFSGFCIVQISDLHARTLGKNHEKLLSAVAEQSPDLIAITGDLMDRDGQLDVLTPLLEKLTAIAPVYYVTGNHEYSTGALPALYGVMEQLGVQILNNRYVTLERNGSTLILAGVEDPNGDINMKTPEALLSEIHESAGEGAYVVLLAHRYELAERYAQAGADLILSGHAHGGLIRLPFTDGLIGPGHDFLPQHTSGLYSLENGARLVASRGLAQAQFVPRLFNPLHLPVIRFE